MSIVSGTMGAVMGANAQKDSAQQGKDAANANLLEQRRVYDQQRADFDPYLQAGYRGLGQAENFDLMQGVGPAVDYNKEYTDKLGNYKQSEGFTAQNALGQQALQRQLNARGLNYGATGASTGAELEQKLTANDFDKYRTDLSDRYKALQGEYALRRDVNQNQYTKLMDMVKVGQGAAGSVGQAGSQYGTQAANAFQNLGQANNGQSAWSGMGAASANTAGAGLKGYQAGKDMGWWGGGAGAAGGAMTAGEAGGTFAGNTMLSGMVDNYGAALAM